MGAPRFEIYFKQRVFAVCFYAFVVRYRRIAVLKNAAFYNAVAKAANRCVYCVFSRYFAAHNGVIILFYFACKLCRGKLVFCRQHYSACVPIQPENGAKGRITLAVHIVRNGV